MDMKVRSASLLLTVALVPAALFAAAGDVKPCASCHVCPQPTAEDPCLDTCLRHAAAAPDHAEGADVVVLDDLENLYEPVRFSHRVHARMAALGDGCASCHHASPAEEVYLPCKACHSPAVQREQIAVPGLKGAYHRQCMSCHQEWSAGTQCEVCHALKAESAAQGEAHVAAHYKTCREPERQVFETESGAGPVVTFFHRNHTALYGTQCSDCHRQDPCVSCHYQGDRAPRPAGGGEVIHGRCAACHDTEDLSGCEKCHTETAREDPLHAWPLGEMHGGLDCTDCHGQRFNAPPDCGGCHEESAADLLAKRRGS